MENVGAVFLNQDTIGVSVVITIAADMVSFFDDQDFAVQL
jgi:hypothetical protein